MKRQFLIAIFCGLLVTLAVNAGEGKREYKPLDWAWSPSEKKEITALSKKVVVDHQEKSFLLETENWQIKTWHTPIFTAQAGLYMEIFSRVFFKAFILKEERGFKNFKPLLCIYPDRDAYLKGIGRDENDWSGGLCQVSWRTENNQVIPAITLSAYFKTAEAEPTFNSKVPLGTIQHEATHCLLQCVYGAMMIPLWLNEGAASYYEAWSLREKISEAANTPKDEKAREKRHFASPAPQQLKAYFQKNQNMPRLDKLVSANTHQEFYVDNGGELTRLNYDLAESFIEFLMIKNSRRDFMLNVLARVKYQNGVSTEQTPFVTPEEALQYEKEWLMFLESHWKCKFDAEKIKERVKELKKRVQKMN